MTPDEQKQEVIDLLEKAYWAMNDVEDAMAEGGFAASLQLESANILDAIHTLQKNVKSTQEPEAQP